MKTQARTHGVALTALAAALLGAYGAAQAQDVAPQSTVEVGAGAVSDEGLRFGRYNGLDNSQVYGLIDADVRRRDAATGT